MVVMPIDAFEMPSILVFGGQRVVEIDVEPLGGSRPFGLLDGPAKKKATERLAHILRRPGTDAQTVGHVGDIGSLDKLPSQAGQCLARLAHQYGLDDVEQMPRLRLREG